MKASLLESKCIHCKKCIEEHFCEFNALTWNTIKEIPIVNYLACEGCNACKVLCSEHAFEIKSVKSGEIISYNTEKDFPIVYGKTRLGSTTSGKLVSDVKEYAQNLEKLSNSNFTIIDGPPGIGCPVIATLSGLDFVILITEPTPSGLHDLVRALEVVKQFRLPFGIIINKSNLKSSFQNKFNLFINETGYNVLGKIPFDLEIPKSMSFAKPIVDFNPKSDASIAINKIYLKIKKILSN